MRIQVGSERERDARLPALSGHASFGLIVKVEATMVRRVSGTMVAAFREPKENAYLGGEGSKPKVVRDFDDHVTWQADGADRRQRRRCANARSADAPLPGAACD